MYKITKEFQFSASHQLEELPLDHKCARLHGHNYKVRVELQSKELNQYGFVVDYGDLKPLKNFIDSTLDHRHLDDVFDFHTSAENIAKFLYDWCKGRWPQTVSVSVSETSRTWATYSKVYRDI